MTTAIVEHFATLFGLVPFRRTLFNTVRFGSVPVNKPIVLCPETRNFSLESNRTMNKEARQ